MLVDLALDDLSDLKGDVAIVGAGAAGIILARDLLARGFQVLLLESGGRDFEPQTADLNDGENVGMDYYPLDHARLRFFGGTTSIWGGRCAELDPIDFEKRSWVPHSGWPVSYTDLATHYASARKLFDLPTKSCSAQDLRKSGVPLPHFASDELAIPTWSFDSMHDRFTIARCEDLVSHPRCTIVLHANVCDIRTDAQAKSVSHLSVARPNRERIPVKARQYVLAAGGIENPRLLLASRSVMPNGLGNAHDQVGRFFMEHPHARGGHIAGAAAWTLFKAFSKRKVAGHTAAACLAPSPELQERDGLLNTSLTIAPRKPADGKRSFVKRAYLYARQTRDPTRFGRALWKATKKGSSALQRLVHPLRPWLYHRMGQTEVALVVRAEQAPNPDSRVKLAGDVDAFDIPRVQLNWQTNALDVDSVAGLVHALGRETERLGLGRVMPAPWLSDPSRNWHTDDLISAHAIGGYHHMGTTRMSDDPKQGVTDSYGRVHGMDNLYIAGSSLFTTSGWANPTLTIAALALRTAEKLSEYK